MWIYSEYLVGIQFKNILVYIFLFKKTAYVSYSFLVNLAINLV